MMMHVWTLAKCVKLCHMRLFLKILRFLVLLYVCDHITFLAIHIMNDFLKNFLTASKHLCIHNARDTWSIRNLLIWSLFSGLPLITGLSVTLNNVSNRGRPISAVDWSISYILSEVLDCCLFRTMASWQDASLAPRHPVPGMTALVAAVICKVWVWSFHPRGLRQQRHLAIRAGWHRRRWPSLFR